MQILSSNFFDLVDAVLINSRIVYQELNGNLNLFDSKIVVVKSLNGKYGNRQIVFSHSRPAKKEILPDKRQSLTKYYGNFKVCLKSSLSLYTTLRTHNIA